MKVKYVVRVLVVPIIRMNSIARLVVLKNYTMQNCNLIGELK
jgi:hypothetical protein